MLPIILLLMVQNCFVYSMEEGLNNYSKVECIAPIVDDSYVEPKYYVDAKDYVDYYTSDKIKNIVTYFCTLYTIQQPPVFTILTILPYLKQNVLTKTVENIRGGTEQSIENCKKNNLHDDQNVNNMIESMAFLEKIKKIMNFYPILIKELKECSRLPMVSRTDDNNSLFLEKMWYCYLLYMIPSNTLYFSKKPYKINKILTNCPIEYFTENLRKKRIKFLNLFSSNKKVYSSLKNTIIPLFRKYIELKKGSSDSDVDSDTKPFDSIPYEHIVQSLQTIVQYAEYNPNYTTGIECQLDERWRDFWKEDPSNAEDLCKNIMQAKALAFTQQVNLHIHTLARQNEAIACPSISLLTVWKSKDK